MGFWRDTKSSSKFMQAARLPFYMYKQEAHMVEQRQFGKPTEQMQVDPIYK